MWPPREQMSLFLICKPGWAWTEHSRVWAATEMARSPWARPSAGHCLRSCGTRSGQAEGGQRQSRTQRPGRAWREAGARGSAGGSDPESQQPS